MAAESRRLCGGDRVESFELIDFRKHVMISAMDYTSLNKGTDARRNCIMTAFVAELRNGTNPDLKENVFYDIWKEYESVILQSLVTSFGLDFIVHDRHGGDVDTVHNVRQIGIDAEMKYKNANYESDYANRGAYDSAAYHKDSRYIAINKNISEKKKNGELIDSYTGKKLARNAKVDLDHAVASKEVHEDRGRVLAGLSGLDLANNEDNLKPTDRSINRSMKEKDMDAYIVDWGKKTPERKNRIVALKEKNFLTDKERKELEKLEKLDQIDPDKMRAENQKARKAYNAKIQRAYYTSEKFYRYTAIAAGSRGLEMGMRQAVGLIFVEIYMGAEYALRSIPANSSLEDMLKAVGTGVKNGAENAKKKYKEILSKFGEGFISGSLASITTTICNIFFTTAKNLVRNIRQIYASVVQAGKVLLFNPDDLMFGDRIKTATVILATGASVMVGTVVGDMIGATPIGSMAGIGEAVRIFSSTLVSGLLSCTLLVFLDRSKFINQLIAKLNTIATEVNNYREIADAMESLAAKMANLDIAKFRAETAKYYEIAQKMDRVQSEKELNSLLLSAYQTFDIQIPWRGDFDTFMGNKKNRLVFE